MMQTPANNRPENKALMNLREVTVVAPSAEPSSHHLNQLSLQNDPYIPYGAECIQELF